MHAGVHCSPALDIFFLYVLKAWSDILPLNVVHVGNIISSPIPDDRFVSAPVEYLNRFEPVSNEGNAKRARREPTLGSGRFDTSLTTNAMRTWCSCTNKAIYLAYHMYDSFYYVAYIKLQYESFSMNREFLCESDQNFRPGNTLRGLLPPLAYVGTHVGTQTQYTIE